MKRKALTMAVIGGVILMLSSSLSQRKYPEVKPGEEQRVNGVWISRGSGVSMGLTADDMESLIYGTDEIPGLTCVPNPYNHNHTVIILDGFITHPFQGIMNKISRGWIDLQTAEAYLQAVEQFRKKPSFETREIMLQKWTPIGSKGIGIDLTVYDKPIIRPGEPSLKGKRRSFSGIPLGEESYVLSRCKLYFCFGRAFVIVSSWDGLFSEALAWGIVYRLQQHPKKLVGAIPKPKLFLTGNPLSKGQTEFLTGVAVAPSSLFRKFNDVRLSVERTPDIWTMTFKRNGRWVKVKAFSWEMETDKGKVKLERPVFPYKGDLIVPLRQVAEALGITVHQKGQTIALMTE